MTTSDLVSFISLGIAAIAVLVGPFVSWKIAKREIGASGHLAEIQLIAPMRQAWINSLRDTLAELLSKSLYYHVAGFEERKDNEYASLALLEQKAILMLNPNEDDHQRLEALIRAMVANINGDEESREKFVQTHSEATSLTRQLIKREWDRLKHEVNTGQ